MQHIFWGGGEGANKVHYGKCGSGVLAGPIEQQVNRNTIMVTGIHTVIFKVTIAIKRISSSKMTQKKTNESKLAKETEQEIVSSNTSV